MTDHVIDTNVLLAASAIDPESEFDDAEHVPAEKLREVYEWLRSFGNEKDRQLVLDYQFTIWKEYKSKLSRQDYGWVVARKKFEAARWQSISTDDNETAQLPEDLEDVVYDVDDRKFVAVALKDMGQSSIANACDTDWYDWQEELEKYGIQVVQIIDRWCKAEWKRKNE